MTPDTEKDEYGANLRVVKTTDGSYTLYLPLLDEHYHSVKGAVAESSHVFINAGFDYCKKGDLSILEIGLGTGLNLLLTIMSHDPGSSSITYHGIEKNPIPPEITGELSRAFIPESRQYRLFNLIHAVEWDRDTVVSTDFIIRKIHADLLKYTFTNKYDLVYFDAFSPSKQPELWAHECLARVLEAIKPGGIFVTYSATGKLKRTLKAYGFIVESLPGSSGKREMVRALKKY